MTVKIVDRGANKVTRQVLGGAKGVSVDVGILGTSGGSDAHSQSGVTVAEVAEFHEFGLGVPRRSWLRDWVDDNENAVFARMERLYVEVLAGRLTNAQALAQLGLWIEGQIKANIAAGIAPPLAASTIARKGSDTPLIDTGQLRSAISHRLKL